MTLVKLKMRFIYKSFLIMVGLVIILLLSIGALYFVNDKVKESLSDIEVNRNLSINYIDAKNFSVAKNGTIKFTISNNSNDVSYYTIGFSKVRGLGSYKLLNNDTVILEGEIKSTTNIANDYLSIDALETKEFTLELTNNDEYTLSGSLSIKYQENKIKNFADILLKNNAIKTNAVTKVGVEAATMDEGLIKSIDDNGVTYYYRGNVKNNYVSFGNQIWRIVRINGDGTVRIVLDGVIPSLASYYTSSTISSKFEESNIYTVLNSWLEENLKNVRDYIALSKYCSDTSHDDQYIYNANTRILVNKIPIINCLGTVVRSNIGLLSIDEVIFAGASTSSNNHSYYLYNSNIINSWYTMSAVRGSENSQYMFLVDTNGSINTNTAGNLYRAVRPVINLDKNIFLVGTGTQDDPYRLEE